MYKLNIIQGYNEIFEYFYVGIVGIQFESGLYNLNAYIYTDNTKI
jgi:hypothetical protein